MSSLLIGIGGSGGCDRGSQERNKVMRGGKKLSSSQHVALRCLGAIQDPGVAGARPGQWHHGKGRAVQEVQGHPGDCIA